MRLRFFQYLQLLVVIITVNTFSQSEFQLQPGTIIRLVDGDEAKNLITTEDEYTAVLSKFDLQSKSGKTGDATLQDYFDYSVKQIVKWDDDEKENMKNVVTSVSKKISALGLKLNMPPVIQVIKSTMKNEGGAEGYTRGTYIVLKDSWVGSSSSRMEDLFIHELFHVLSRQDSGMREKVYNTMGFKKCNEVAYPKELADLRISNPDAPSNNYYITVTSGGSQYDIVLILYSEKPYEGGSFFYYLKVGMLAVDGNENEKQPVYRDGKPLLLNIDKVKNFYEQIGKNSNYIFHAEELSADQFVQILNQDKDVPNPEILEAMKNAMK